MGIEMCIYDLCDQDGLVVLFEQEFKICCIYCEILLNLILCCVDLEVIVVLGKVFDCFMVVDNIFVIFIFQQLFV